MSGELRVIPVAGLPEFTARTSIGAEIGARAELLDGDVVVVSQKIVSKAEGRVRRLSAAIPGGEARRLAAVLGKEPALVELILGESREVLRAERGVLIVETHHGFVCANAGIDTSNLPEPNTVSLLPEDPDASARRIRAEIRAATGTAPAVIVSDSFGRAWRLGQAEVAIGCAGIAPLDDWRGRTDTAGRQPGGNRDRNRRPGSSRRRPRPQQDQPSPSSDRPRPRPLRQLRRLPRRCQPSADPRARTFSADVRSIPVGAERLVLFR